MSSTIDPLAALSASSSSSSAAAAGAGTAGSAQNFLTMLVTQMQNQDPLNPMDNAQITSQLAQINTVTGINTLNTTVQGLNTQFVQMQALQGASLVGHDVTVQGNKLAIANGSGVGGFDLASAADKVSVDVLDASGRVADTLQFGALSSGKHSFAWPAGSVADGSAYTFRVNASAGAAAVTSTALMRDRVDAVSTSGNTLNLELDQSGSVPYSAVVAFN
ncbi:MAG: flagellar biosynthesis protein FlgD [Rubrivivax sp. SCN 70-15]|nr:MAG: flagellar biosynthesis protein FlgD [Rubrivivax sp. SCN 70-15]